MTKHFNLKAGERTRVIQRFSNSIPATFLLRAKTLDESQTLSGLIEIETSALLFDKKTSQLTLKAEQSLNKGYWDSFYSVFITPDYDIELSLSGAPLRAIHPLFIITLIIVIIALGLFLIR